MLAAFLREQRFTKADRRVLNYLVSLGAPRAVSTRKLADTLDLSRRTVQASLARLRKSGHLRSAPGWASAPPVHTVLKIAPVPEKFISVPVVKKWGVRPPEPTFPVLQKWSAR